MKRLIALTLLVACFRPRDSYTPHNACPTRCVRVDEFGVIPDSSSALNSSEVRIGGEYARAGENNAQEQSSWTPLLGARWSGEHLTVHADWNPVYFTADDADGTTLPEDSKYASSGNLRVGAGYRFIHAPLGGLYRRGLAFQTALGIDLEDHVSDDGVSETSIGNRLADLRPFDRVRFNSGQYYEQRLELRYELVGCHAPFIHFQAGVTARKDFSSDTISVPASVTVGAHPNRQQNAWWLPPPTIYAGYDVLGGHLPNPDQNDWDFEHRFRIGIQLGPKNVGAGWWTIPVRIEYASLVGTSDGLTLGVYLVMPLNVGGFDEAPQER
jgi:hypothetical protein